MLIFTRHWGPVAIKYPRSYWNSRSVFRACRKSAPRTLCTFAPSRHGHSSFALKNLHLVSTFPPPVFTASLHATAFFIFFSFSVSLCLSRTIEHWSLTKIDQRKFRRDCRDGAISVFPSKNQEFSNGLLYTLPFNRRRENVDVSSYREFSGFMAGIEDEYCRSRIKTYKINLRGGVFSPGQVSNGYGYWIVSIRTITQGVCNSVSSKVLECCDYSMD